MKTLILFLSLIALPAFSGNVGGGGAPLKPPGTSEEILTDIRGKFGNVGGGGRSFNYDQPETVFQRQGGNVGGN